MESQGRTNCSEHYSEDLKGFCKDWYAGIWFRWAIGKHRNHNIVMLDEFDGGDLLTQIDNFENKLTNIKDKAKSLLDKANRFDSHQKKLPDILDKFREITNLFESGFYKKMIVGELEKNYMQINEMAEKLSIEANEDSRIFKLPLLDAEKDDEFDIKDFEYISSIIDERRALITKYEQNLKTQKTLIAEYNHIDIDEHIIEFFQSLFIVKKKLTDRRIIHYFEWGNKNIHFYDVVNHKQTKYLVDFDKYIPKFCRTVVTDHGRLFCIAGRHQDNMWCNWMLEYIEEKKWLEHRAVLNDSRSDFTAIYDGEMDRIYAIGGNDAKNFYTNCEYYDVNEDKWMRIAHLNVARDSAACCIFNSKYIYVFSGRIKFNPKEITDVWEMYDIEKKNWEIINLNKKNRWVPCDLAMCYQISPTNILIFGGFDRQNRTNATFVFNTSKNIIERASDLPTVGSFSTMVFHIEDKVSVSLRILS